MLPIKLRSELEPSLQAGSCHPGSLRIAHVSLIRPLAYIDPGWIEPVHSGSLDGSTQTIAVYELPSA